jgi:hypothetical protein
LALYYKGRIRGGGLFQRVRLTGHLDTAKRPRFEEFFEETLDPHRDDAVYGDSAEEVRDANARGKLYVQVEADRSKATVGNFRTDLRSGGELFRYDRTVYGAEVDLQNQLGPVKQEVKAFATTGGGGLARDVNLFRATGGSLYYLRHDRLVEGGERIRWVMRDRDNGLVLRERALQRDLDYTIDYAAGRILFKGPVASISESAFVIDNLEASQTPLDGHPVYVEVTYEYEVDERRAAGAAGGAAVQGTFFDTVAVGAGIVGEGRDEQGGLGDYALAGADASWQASKRTSLRAEVARSYASDAGHFVSLDGGLTFLGLNAVGLTVPDAGRGAHYAWKLGLQSTLGDLVQAPWAERTRLTVYAQDLDRGFFAAGSILEQGRRKLGGTLVHRLDGTTTFTLRHDAEVAELPRVGPSPETVMAAADPLVLDERATYVTTLQWARLGKRHDLTLEVMHQRLSSTATLADGSAALDAERVGAGALVARRFGTRLTLRAAQEVQATLTDADPTLRPFPHSHPDRDYDNRLAGVATSVGADYRLGKDVRLSGTGALRWNGDTAAIVGLRTPLSPSSSVYLSERFEDRSGRMVSTSLVGAEERFGARRGGKAYGEYQLESGVSGVRNRAVLGVGHRFSLLRDWTVFAGYEHQQTFAGYLPDGTPTGENLRDVVHVGSEYLRSSVLKASAALELRFDDGVHGQGLGPDAAVAPRYEDLLKMDPRPVAPPGTYPEHGGTAPGTPLTLTPGKSLQVVVGAGLDWKWTRDLTFLGRFHLSHTEDTTNQGREELPAGVPSTFLLARFLSATAGWAYRPLELDWLDVLGKYTFLLDLRPVGLGRLGVENRSHVLSAAPIVDLPFRLRYSGKLAWKRTSSEAELIEDQRLRATVDALLWLTRLGYRVTDRWDLSVEHRLLRLYRPDGGERRQGVLVEADYWVSRRNRLGVGYTFSRFSDDELADLERDAHGFFFRVVGRY